MDLATRKIMGGESRGAATTSSTAPSDKDDEVSQLCAKLDAITKASSATPGCQFLAALVCAARCARQAGVYAPVAAALLADYIAWDHSDV